MQSFMPNDMLPIWSELPTPGSLKGCTEVIQQYKDYFHDKWTQFYQHTVVRQNKWFTDSPYSPLQPLDIVLITDLLHNNYMTLRRIVETQQDTAGTTRYYKVLYKRKNNTTAGQMDIVSSRGSVDDIESPKVWRKRIKVIVPETSDEMVDRL